MRVAVVSLISARGLRLFLRAPHSLGCWPAARLAMARAEQEGLEERPRFAEMGQGARRMVCSSATCAGRAAPWRFRGMQHIDDERAMISFASGALVRLICDHNEELEGAIFTVAGVSTAITDRVEVELIRTDGTGAAFAAPASKLELVDRE